MITGEKENHFSFFNIACRSYILIAVTVLVFAILLSILDKLTQIPEKHRMVTQSSDPTALSKITDGLHTNVIPATVKQDGRMFFPSSVVMTLGLQAFLFLMYFTFKFIF